MSSYEERRPLPKFGEWDVNNPASADGFSGAFNRARDEKKTGGAVGSQRKYESKQDKYKHSIKRKWFCCG